MWGFISFCSKSCRYCCLSFVMKFMLKICNLWLLSVKWWVKSERCRYVWNNIKRGWCSGLVSFLKGYVWFLVYYVNSNLICIFRRFGLVVCWFFWGWMFLLRWWVCLCCLSVWSNCWWLILFGCWLFIIVKRVLLNVGNKICFGRC